MTIDRFMNNYGIKNKKTVIKWVIDGLIPGADLMNNYVPDSARPPYTKARAKNSDAVYVSIVRAAYNRRHVMPQLYNMCDDEFNGYIARLEQAGLIVSRVSDGITYYDATIGATDINKRFILQVIETVTRATAEGVANAALNPV